MGEVEQKMLEILLDVNHLFLIIGIMSIIYFLKTIKPIEKFLFSTKWKWLISLVNLSLSALGIFLLGMTNAVQFGMKLMIMFLITAVTTAAYQYTKKIFESIVKKLVSVVTKKPNKPTG